VPTLHTYDYALIRVVPRVEREEFVNAGVIVSCERPPLLLARLALDVARLRALDPDVDLEMVQRQLAAIERICNGAPDAGPIAALPLRARFHWLTARRSAVIQTSPVHSGRCDDPQRIVTHLIARMVEAPGRAG
jgi:hypothetical protein